MMGVITLVSESPKSHGVFEAAQETTRTLKCSIATPSMSEQYAGKAQGLEPTYRFTLANYRDYSGERIVEYRGKRYPVIRTYQNDNYGIEITVDGGGQFG